TAAQHRFAVEVAADAGRADVQPAAADAGGARRRGAAHRIVGDEADAGDAVLAAEAAGAGVGALVLLLAEQGRGLAIAALLAGIGAATGKPIVELDRIDTDAHAAHPAERALAGLDTGLAARLLALAGR